MESHWLTRPATIRKLWVGFIAILVATVAVEPLVTHEAYFGIDGTFAFNAWYGFVTCIAFMVIAKLLGLVLRRPETYYDDKRDV